MHKRELLQQMEELVAPITKLTGREALVVTIAAMEVVSKLQDGHPSITFGMSIPTLNLYISDLLDFYDTIQSIRRFGSALMLDQSIAMEATVAVIMLIIQALKEDNEEGSERTLLALITSALLILPSTVPDDKFADAVAAIKGVFSQG